MTEEKFLCIDIGGSHVKAAVLDASGKILQPYSKIDTPEKAKPEDMMQTIKQLTASFSGFDKIAVGFPGYVKRCDTNSAQLKHKSLVRF
jgi:polyphosphate glucokinase